MDVEKYVNKFKALWSAHNEVVSITDGFGWIKNKSENVGVRYESNGTASYFNFGSWQHVLIFAGKN